jgi:very-short-patch-repair endonuclease
MAQAGATEQSAAIDDFVNTAIQQYRQKLLDLSSRNPLISFRHSERSRSHIRIVDEIPELLFNRLSNSRQVTFVPLPYPELIPADERVPLFESAIQNAKRTDELYKEELAELGPSPSDRQIQKVERELRNRIRAQLGLPLYEPTLDPKKRAAELSIPSDYDLPLPTGNTARRHNDLNIQTLFFREDLDRKLSALRESTRVLLQDAGLSALYCAFGFLEYYDTEASDQKRLAPLVFFPIELNRELDRGEYRYFIQGRNDEIEVNVALKELLRKEYGVELPEWVGDEDGETNALAVYLAEVEQIASNRKDWAVRRFVTVGLFTFAMLAMYEDLDPDRWPEESPLHCRHVLRSLIAGAEVHGTGSAPDYEVDDPALPDALLITDADSSQHSAVIDVLKGNNIVVQGPPGTGKSQTITNIIAAALDAGKSVLFVAEKMAALEVVQKRLTAAGLNPFCLELHSSKTSKSAVVQSLTNRLEYRDSKVRQDIVASNLAALRKARADLLYYVHKSNEIVGETGLSVREVLLGSATRDHQRTVLPSTLASGRMRNALVIDRHMREEMLDAATNLEEQSGPLKRFGSIRNHPWRGLQNSEITDLEIDQLISSLKRWHGSLSHVAGHVQQIEQTTSGKLPVSAHDLTELCSRLEALPPPPPSLVGTLFPKLSSLEVRSSVKRFLSTFAALLSSIDKLTTYVIDPEAAMKVSSRETRVSYEVLRSLGLTTGSIVHAREIGKDWSTLTSNLQKCASISNAITAAFGIENPTLSAIRASCAGVQQLEGLSQDLWHSRDSTVLAEENASVFHEASKRCKALRSRREKLRAKWNLSLLPDSAEVRGLVIALRTTSWITAFMDSQCRRARKLAKAAALIHISRAALAAELLDCAQYLDDERSFLSDERVRQACGSIYSGMDTDFDRIAAIRNWAETARQQLAPYSHDGNNVLHALFDGNPSKLREIAGLAKSDSYVLLARDVLPFLANESTTLGQVRESVLAKYEQLDRTLSTIAPMGVRESLPLSGLEPLAELLSYIETRIREVDNAAASLDLTIDRNVDARVWMSGVSATLDYADCVLNAMVPSCVEQFIFADTAHLTLLRSLFLELREKLRLTDESCQAVFLVGKIDTELWCGESVITACDISRLIERCNYALSEPAALNDYTNFLLAEEAGADAGLGPVLSAFAAAQEDYRELSGATEFVFYRSCAEQVLEIDPRLRNHSGASHEHLRKQYQRLDREYLSLRRQFLANKLCARAVPEGNSIGRVGDLTELALVQRVSGQTRPRISLRELFRRAGRAVQALTPCWMMSPMSVAQFLEPGALEFDLLLMDEASQIRPEEALGAIARATQVVIVGDQMQLPPTPFFQKLSTDSTDEEEEMEDVKQESVLEAAASRFYPPRRLKWHYRSEHGSLISFSNDQFYNNDLTVFPSPYHEHPEYGVQLSQVNGVYTAGTNHNEAEAVVKAAFDFMAACPNQSLGIVAVNSKQAELIRELMDHLFASEPSAEAYRARWEPELESLFVKNLENVQGDERDVIFISTVYGKDGNGNFYQRFGPINSLYGHRRLNVLFTRAKKRVVVFSSMTPEDIQDEGKHWGVRALKAYLQYARDGRFILPEAGRAGDSCDSEFEEWVLQTLRANGFDAVTQYGFAGYRIDIAVRHPKRPGIFLCGVECDGATYHSARSVRERDRLRQEVLERLGWKIFRIWSTDWFRNPALQTKNLLEYLNKLAVI